MIRNIIFDMGRVLLDYDAMPVCRAFTDNEEAALKVRAAIFDSGVWGQTDLGYITDEEAGEIACGYVEDEELRTAVRQAMRHWTEYNLWVFEGTAQAVEYVREKGLGLYILSNASHRFREYQGMIPHIDWFDGIMISAEEHLVKPDRAFYERLCEKYRLKPEECFFIDDMQHNVDGAAAVGIRGYCFADRDVGRLMEKLKEVTGRQ